MIARRRSGSIEFALQQDRDRARLVGGVGCQVNARRVLALTAELGQALHELERGRTVLVERDLLDAVFDSLHPLSSDLGRRPASSLATVRSRLGTSQATPHLRIMDGSRASIPASMLLGSDCCGVSRSLAAMVS